MDEFFSNGSEIDEALQQAVKEALLLHKKEMLVDGKIKAKGNSLVI